MYIFSLAEFFWFKNSFSLQMQTYLDNILALPGRILRPSYSSIFGSLNSFLQTFYTGTMQQNKPHKLSLQYIHLMRPFLLKWNLFKPYLHVILVMIVMIMKWLTWHLKSWWLCNSNWMLKTSIFDVFLSVFLILLNLTIYIYM